MFDESLIVTSALSAFNNAALVPPMFLWNAVLCIPLFVVAYIFGKKIAAKQEVMQYITLPRMAFWFLGLVAIWVILTGGGYNVLRDGLSALPWVSGVALFLAAIFIGNYTKSLRLPWWYGNIDASARRKWAVNICCWLLGALFVFVCCALNWYWAAIRIIAIAMGFVIGRYILLAVRGSIYMLLVGVISCVAVLMQPEFFRFGQLGNLTLAHLVWVLATGIMFAVAFAFDIVHPRGRIHHSAYVKLKWLTRLASVLGIVLFLLTESVPMFLFSVVSVFAQCAISVWHAVKVSPNSVNRSLSLFVMFFGVLIDVPTITVIGVIWLATMCRKSPDTPDWFLL